MSKHVKLGLIAFCCALLPMTVMTTLASSSNRPPTPPAGFRSTADVPAGAAVVKSEKITLGAAECKAIGMSGKSSCTAEHRWYSANHRALPAGTQVASGPSLFADHVALAAGPYWYWSVYDQICSIYGCWYGSLSSWEDGAANGTNVWQWDHGCSPGGYNTSITWCGSFYNGGGWPYYAMQFGMNGNACLIVSYGTGCFNHGLRRWVDDYGNPGYFSSW
jgi:hypothetical protein